MEEICRSDPRIRYEAHPKSQRFDEIYRDRIIRQSGAGFVLQLGDDDLWAPNHLDCMLDLLQNTEWANQAPLRVAPDGTAEWWPTSACSHLCPGNGSLVVLGYERYDSTCPKTNDPQPDFIGRCRRAQHTKGSP
jgi:hypothetical protein